MTVFVDLGNRLLVEALSQLLMRVGYDHVVINGQAPASGFSPDVLLVDGTALTPELLARYPEAKVLLIDTGLEPENLRTMLLSHRIHGVLSPTTHIHLFKKALEAVSRRQLWIDNASVKALFHSANTTDTSGKIKTITGREQEIVASICEGLSNKEIADRFGLSPCTVRAHLYRIYKKLGVNSRSKLMAQTMNGHKTTYA